MPRIANARDTVQQIVRRQYAPFRESAHQANAAVELRTHTDLPDPGPVVRLRTSDLGKLRVEVTLFCPSQAAEQLESDITCEILEAFQPTEPQPPATVPSETPDEEIDQHADTPDRS